MDGIMLVVVFTGMCRFYQNRKAETRNFRAVTLFCRCSTMTLNCLTHGHRATVQTAWVEFVAKVFMGDNLNNRSLPGVKINVIIDRHAGFLTDTAGLSLIEFGPVHIKV